MQQAVQSCARAGGLRAVQTNGGPVSHHGFGYGSTPLLTWHRMPPWDRSQAVVVAALRRLAAPPSLITGVDRHLTAPPPLGAVGFMLVLPPLGNLSNGFYQVHSRRNDRVIAARAPLSALYPEIDVAPIAFTGQLLATLAAICPRRFAQVHRDLSQQWAARIEQLLGHLPAQGLLLEPPAAPWAVRPRLALAHGIRRLALGPDDLVGTARAIIALGSDAQRMRTPQRGDAPSINAADLAAP